MKRNRFISYNGIATSYFVLALLSLQFSLMSRGDGMRLHEFLGILANFLELLHVLDVWS